MNFVENKKERTILWFDQISNDDGEFVGSKNALLGELYNFAVPLGIRVPNGFSITVHAYRLFLHETGLAGRIRGLLDGLDIKNSSDLEVRGRRIREACVETQFPAALEADIRQAYRDLSNAYGVSDVDSAVLSSAGAEDVAGALLADGCRTVLNVAGADVLVDTARKIFASLFTDHAISCRVEAGVDHLSGALSVGVQKMVRSDLGCSGSMVTLDTKTGFRDVVEIDSLWGLGETDTTEKGSPDTFLVWKPGVKEGYRSLIKKEWGEKRSKTVCQKGSTRTKEVTVSIKERKRFTLTDDEVLLLAQGGMAIERHYSDRSGRATPMNIKWAKDGITGELFIVRAYPEPAHREREGFEIIEYNLAEKGEVFVEGISIGTKIATGVARVILSPRKLASFKEGEILVTENTDPEWEPIMKKAAGIITEHGGRTSHAAIVACALSIPAVVGVHGVIAKIKPGTEITVDTSSGGLGRVYRGALSFEKKIHERNRLSPTRTPVGLTMDNPQRAFACSFLPHHGVGLLRTEFISASHIKVHPLALTHYKTIKDQKLKRQISALTEGYDDKQEFFVTKLSEGIATIGAAFAPYPVYVRFSDFTTNEYRGLLGGTLFETREENPVMGQRGVSRYTDPRFEAAFRLEVAAIKRARDVFGVRNLEVLVPFCRTPQEGRRVIEIMRDAGLAHDASGTRIHVVCETPAHVLRADEFLDMFDGFLIDPGRLAQFSLGLDQDLSVALCGVGAYGPSISALVAQGIEVCKRRGKYVGFCAGMAPIDPEVLRLLVAQKVDLISVTPDRLAGLLDSVANEESTQEHGEV
ncbi:MAG: phosphoenolpyruvate synthase [Minisyncoccota bacterium]